MGQNQGRYRSNKWGNTYAYETKSGAKLSNEVDDNNRGNITEGVSYEYSYEQPIIEKSS